jgi:hypothetical protein
MYSREIVLFVCDPCTGLPGNREWMPSVAEVKTACDARAADLAKYHRFKNWGKSLAAPKDEDIPKDPEKPKPTLKELHAKYGGATWGIGQDVQEPSKVSPTMTPEKITEHYETHAFGGARKQAVVTPASDQRKKA